MTESAYLKRLLAKAAENLKTIVLPESEDDRVLDAAHFVAEAGAARPVILGSPETVEGYYRGKGWSMEGIEVISPENSPRLAAYAEMFFELRKDKGVTAEDALKQMHNYNYFGTMMIKAGDADGMVSGANHSTADTVRPALQIIKSAKKGRAVSSAVLEVVNGKPYILSDCAIVINPTAPSWRTLRWMPLKRLCSSALSRTWRCFPILPRGRVKAKAWTKLPKPRGWPGNSSNCRNIRICRSKSTAKCRPMRRWMRS